MAGSTIKIKRSSGAVAPATLKPGELAVTWGGPGDYTNKGDRLFVGAGDANTVTGDATRIDVIGGKFFTDRLDHQEGVLTADSAIVVDSNKKVNELFVDWIKIDNNEISSTGTGTEAHITLTPNVANSGVINLNGPVHLNGQPLTVSGEVSVANTVVATDVRVNSLATNSLVFTDGLKDLTTSTNLTYDGSTLAIGANTTITATSLDVTANTTIVGIVDVTGATTVTGDVTINANANSATTVAITDSSISVTADITPSADSTYDVGSATNRFAQIHGDTVYVEDTLLASSNTSQLVITQANGSPTDVVVDGAIVTTLNAGDIDIANNSIVNSAGDINIHPQAAGSVDFGGAVLTSVADPVANTDAVTLKFLREKTISIAADTGNSDTVNLLSGTITFAGGDGINTEVTDDQIIFDIANTGVVAATYGSQTEIPVLTINTQGQVTSASEVAIATTLNFAADTQTANTDAAIDLLTETLSILGGTGVDTNVSANNTVTVSIGQEVYTTSNVEFNDVTVGGTLYTNDVTASSVVIQGDLTVAGNTTFINTEEIRLADNVIELNSDIDANTAPTLDAGFSVKRGNELSARFYWDETNDVWTTGPDPNDITKLATLEAVIDGGTF